MRDLNTYSVLLSVLRLFLSFKATPIYHIQKFNSRYQKIIPIFISIIFICQFELFAQVVTGKIEGRIRDVNGLSVSNVFISVTSTVLQGQRSTQTDDRGYFILNLLPPGFYTVNITRITYRSVTIDSLQVILGKTTYLSDIVLIENPYELDKIIITENKILIDPTSAVSGGNFTKNEIEPLPVQRNYQYIPLLLPQITQSFYQDRFSSAGTTGLENRYLIDGIEVTDPIWFGQGISLPYNFIKDIEVLTNGYEAQYRSALGSIINVVTPSGGDKVSGQVFGFYTSNRFTAEQRSIPGEVSESGDFSLYDFGINLGLPIIKEYLWFNVAYNPNFQNEEVFVPGIGNKNGKIISHQVAGKISWKPSGATQLIFNFVGDFYTQDRVLVLVPSGIETYLNPDPALTDFNWEQYSPSIRAVHFFSDIFFLEGSISRYQMNYDVQPTTEIGKEPVFYDYENGTISGGVDHRWDETAVRYNISLKTTLLLDDHIIKAGVEYLDNSLDIKRLYHTVERFSDSLYYFYLVDVDGNVGNRIPSIFIQDSWRINRNWHINAGLRWDGQYIIGSDGNVAQKILDEFQPRIGVIFSPDQTGESKIFASYGRYYQELATIGLPYYFIEGNQALYRSYDHDPRQDPSGEDTLYALASQIQNEISDFKGQYTDEFSLGYERRLMSDYKFSIQGLYRILGEGIEDAFSGERQIFVLGNPGRSPLSEYPGLSRNYLALELVFQKVSKDPFNFSISYVLSKNYGNYQGLFESETGLPGANVSGAFEYPETTLDATGLLPYDRTHVFKFYGSYQFEFGLSIGSFFYLMSGTPLNEFGIGPNGYERIFLQPRGTAGRTSSIWDLNFRLAYMLPQLTSFDYQARFVVDVFHVASQREAVNYDQLHYFGIDENGDQINPNPTYGMPISFQPPMSLRLGLEVNF